MTVNALRAILSLLLAGMLAAACAEEEIAAPELEFPVTVAPVQARTVVDRIVVAGELVAVDEAIVTSEVDGRVTDVVIGEGHSALAGEVVLELDPEGKQLEVDKARAGLEQASAQLDQSKREARRIRELRASGAASQARLDGEESNLRLARASLAAARSQLGLAVRAHRNASVRAPFEGVIARRYVNHGEFVSPGQKLFDLVSHESIEMEFHVPERDSSRIRLGQVVDVTVAPFPDQTFQAVVNMISPRIDADSRTMRVKAFLDNRDRKLRPGLFARADLGLRERPNVVMIPASAILQRADGAIVFRLLEGNVVERLVVRTGIFDANQIEVVEGLKPGDMIVVHGHARLADGAHVDVRSGGTRSSASLAHGGGE